MLPGEREQLSGSWDRTPVLSGTVRIGVLTHIRKCKNAFPFGEAFLFCSRSNTGGLAQRGPPRLLQAPSLARAEVQGTENRRP
jgi:hypothetical protein